MSDAAHLAGEFAALAARVERLERRSIGTGYDGNAWPTYTPPAAQGVALSIGVNYSGLAKIGRKVDWGFNLTVLSAGTSGQWITVTPPFIPVGSSGGNYPVGVGFIYDASTNTMWGSDVWANNVPSIFHFNPYLPNGGTLPGSAGSSFAAASGDIIRGQCGYESTT